MHKSTEWYVLTGGPSSGKTTTIDLLKKTRVQNYRRACSSLY
jgi:predicted ATPase